MYNLFIKSILSEDMFFYHLKTAEAVDGTFNLIPSSNSAVPKSRVARKSVCEHISRCLELVTDKAKFSLRILDFLFAEVLHLPT